MMLENKQLDELISCCCGCGKTRSKFDNRGIERKFISGHNYHKFGLEHPNHKNRKGWIDKKGYKHISIIDENGKIKNVREHRYIFEQHHKIKLSVKDVIHHKNEIRSDNRIENLFRTTGSKHAKIHELGKYKKYRIPNNRYCVICKSKETHRDKNGNAQWYKHKGMFICFKCYRKTL